MQLRTRVSLGSLFAASAVAATVLAWHAQRVEPDCAKHYVEVPLHPAAVISNGQVEPLDEPVPDVLDQAQDQGQAPGPDAPSATIDKLDLGWMPKGYVRDIGADKTAALAQLVEAWAAGDSDEPRIEYRKGIVFVRSAQDRGDDGPYPRSASPQDQRVCGQASVWMRGALRERLANEVLTCDRNVCSYAGMEYAPNGYLVFREITVDGEPVWALDAWVEVYSAALDPQTASQNESDVVRALRHEVGTSCAGEPAGTY